MSEPIVIVDSHVHVHPRSDVAGMLSSAARHFESVASGLGAKEWQGALMLAEMSGVDWFGTMTAGDAPTCLGPWEVSATDAISLRARCARKLIVIVAGRQIATRERLEVLALGTRSVFADGHDLATTIALVQDADALAVLPWGVGKWTGARARLVDAEFRGSNDVLAGDNGGRPTFWPEPSVFSHVRGQGRPVLPGTDPLPLRGESERVGSFGFWFRGQLPSENPGKTLCATIRCLDSQRVHSFGNRQSPWSFVRNQIGLRMAKH